MAAIARRSATPIPHARAHFYAVLARAIAPRPITTVSSWADKYRILTSKSSGEVGQWRTDRTPYLREVMDTLSSNHPCQRSVLMFAAQLGKALDLDTPIPTPAGWTRMGDLQAGDTVLDDCGKPTRVLLASEVFHDRDCYRVEFSDGSSVVADGARWLCGELLEPHPEAKPLTDKQVEKATPDAWMLQFLTDVVTASGLLRYGKQSKALAERICRDAFRMNQSLHTLHPNSIPDTSTADLIKALQFLLSEQCKSKGYRAPGAEMARLAIAKASGENPNE